MKLIRVIVAVFITFIVLNVKAQKDSLNKEVVLYNWKQNKLNLEIVPDNVDTSLYQFQNYNLLLKNQTTYNYLGNLGGPVQQHSFSKRDRYSTGFIFNEAFAEYFHLPEKQKYYNTKRQFTVLKYGNAGKKTESEQFLGVLHSQNVNKNFNVGIDYDMISTEGRYQNQQIRQNNFTLFSSYNGKQYNFHGNFSINRLKGQENGGIDSLTYLGDDDYSNRLNIPVQIDDASIFLYSTNLNLVNEYHIGKKYEEVKVEKKVVKRAQRSSLNQDINNVKNENPEITDSIYYDTTYIRSIKLNGISFSHEFDYSRNARKFYDSKIDTVNEQFYRDKNFIFDSLSSNDQVYQNLIANTFAVKFKKDFINMRFGVRNEQFSYEFTDSIQDTTVLGIDTVLKNDLYKSLSNTSVVAYLGTKVKNVDLGLYGKYYFEGYRKQDVEFQADLNFRLFKSNFINIKGKYYRSEADYLFTRYGSNHFNWRNNSFDKEVKTNLQFIFYNSKSKTKLEVGYTNILNHFYFDTIAEINQYDVDLNILTAELNQEFNLGPFYSISNLVYQESSNDRILSLPTFLAYQSLYYERLFKFKQTGGELLLQFGVDYRFTSGYYADYYMPLSGVFYKQNDFKMEDYHRLDVFLNFNIRRASVYLRYDYVNSSINNTYYYNSPYYPSPQPVFKFGVLWSFYN